MTDEPGNQAYIIVTGSLLGGVEAAFGPFDAEQAAREWAIGNSGEDRFDQWFSMPLRLPTDEPIEEE